MNSFWTAFFGFLIAKLLAQYLRNFNISFFVIARIVTIGMLLVALGTPTYSYYSLLRYIVFATSAYVIYKVYNHTSKNSLLLLLFIAATILFNPIIPFHFPKGTWEIIDLSCAALYVFSFFELREQLITNKKQLEDTSSKPEDNINQAQFAPIKLNLREREVVTNRFIDSDNKEQERANSLDFRTLSQRHIDIIIKTIPEIKNDKQLDSWLGHAEMYYNIGNYSEAYKYLSFALKKYPTLEPFIFNYINICEKVLMIPLEDKDIRYENYLNIIRMLPEAILKQMKWFTPKARCKYCGKYTRFIHPNTPTFGFDVAANSCENCSRMYPMPSWLWDSPDGRAYSYYRMSFSDERFYEEFEVDYEPNPLCKRRQEKSTVL